jgi:hypothetical protein
MTKGTILRQRADGPHRVTSTARAAATLFGGVTGGVTAVYLLTSSLAITVLAAVVGVVIVVLVMHAGR